MAGPGLAARFCHHNRRRHRPGVGQAGSEDARTKAQLEVLHGRGDDRAESAGEQICDVRLRQHSTKRAGQIRDARFVVGAGERATLSGWF